MAVCTLIDNEYASLLFSQTLFSYSFCMLSDFAKVFERKVWRVQVAHLHNSARALSSPNRCFQLSTNLGKDLFLSLSLILWKTNRMSFSDALVKFHWFGINWLFLSIWMQKLLLVYFIIQKIASRAKSGKYIQIWFFPRFGGKKMAAFWACACKLSWTFLSPARVQPLYGAGRKESSGTGLQPPWLVCLVYSPPSKSCSASAELLRIELSGH